jgi:hypothetical protein
MDGIVTSIRCEPQATVKGRCQILVMPRPRTLLCIMMCQPLFSISSGRDPTHPDKEKMVDPYKPAQKWNMTSSVKREYYEGALQFKSLTDQYG